MDRCIICGNSHDEEVVHLFVGEGGIELVPINRAQEIMSGKRNPNWGFEPALE